MRRINDFFEVSEEACYELINESLLSLSSGEAFAGCSPAIVHVVVPPAFASAFASVCAVRSLVRGARAFAQCHGSLAPAEVDGSFAGSWSRGSIYCIA